MKDNKLASRSNRPAKWTWLELLGLSVALFLIISPIASLAYYAIFPPTASGQTTTMFNVSVGRNPASAAPGAPATFTIVLEGRTSDAEVIALTFNVNQGSVINSVSCDVNCTPAQFSISGGTATLNGSISAPATTVTITFNITIGASATGAVVGSVSLQDGNAEGTDATNSITVTGTTPPTTTAVVPTTTAVAPTTTAVAPTTTAVAPTTTAVAPTTTAVAPTTTAVAPTTTAVAPTTTAVAPTTTAGGATPTSTATSTPSPTATTGNTPGGPTATSTATPTATNTPTGGVPNPGVPTNPVLPTRAGVIETPGSGQPGQPGNQPAPTGVIAGRLVARGANLAGARVDLVRRSGGTQSVIPGVVDNSGGFSFLSVRNTGDGESYSIRFSNPDGNGALRFFETNTFTYGGGRLDLPAIDVTDVAIGEPGSSNTVFQLPLTLNWAQRNSGDNYSVTVRRSNGSGVAVDSGNLGGATSFTIGAGRIGSGEYFASVSVRNGQGAGESSRQFRFVIGGAGGGGGSQPTTQPPAQVQPTPTPPPANQTTSVPAPATATPRPPVGGGTQPAATTAPAVATTAAAQTTQARPATASPTTGNGGSNATPTAVVGIGSGQNSGDGTNVGPTLPPGGAGVGQPTTTPPTTGQLPASGGELPLLGLLLAALTLGFRRFRLTVQTNALNG
jgi:hypothetical protein